eukprot:TCONS_00072363-protein
MIKFVLFVLVLALSRSIAMEFPQLPDTYTTGVEVKSDMNENHVIYTAREYRKQNKYSYYFESQRTKNITVTVRNMAVFFDFDKAEAKFVDTTDGRKKCRFTYNTARHVKDVAQMWRSPAATTSQLVGDVESNNYTYEGETVVRNLSCHHWKRHIGNETVDYHFFQTSSGDMKLVRILESNTMIHRHSIYDYFGFRKVEPTLEELQPPLGTYCANVTSNNKTIPEVAEQMTFNVEYRPIRMRTLANYSNLWLAVNYKIFWDMKNDMMRNDHHIKEDGDWKPVKDIMDNNKGILYESFSPMKCRNKTIEDVATTRFPYFKNKHHWVHAREAFLHLKEKRKEFKYEGERFVRGVPCDVWIYRSDQLGEDGFNEIEWYFTQKNVTEISSLGNLREKQVPVRVVGYYGNLTKESFEMEIYDYKHEVTDEDFENPIRDCLKVNGKLYTVQLFILGIPFQKISTISHLKATILKALQEFTERREKGRFMMEFITSGDHVNLLLSIVPMLNENINHLYKIATKIENAIKTKTLKFSYQVSDDGETHEGYFARDFIDFEQARCDFEEPVTSVNKEEIGILIFFVFFALGVGFIVAVALLNWRLAKNGHHLREMLRKRGNLDNEGLPRAHYVNNNDEGIVNPRLTNEDPSPQVTSPAKPEIETEAAPEHQDDGTERKANGDVEMEDIPME